jgi:hypothetical protein
VKKTIKRPDGTEEVVEGTAEEIAEYERKLREGTKPSKKKPVLHGAEVDGIPLTEAESMLVRMKRMGLLEKPDPLFIPYIQPYIQPLLGCQICGQLNCMQTHIWFETTTGTEIKLTS